MSPTKLGRMVRAQREAKGVVVGGRQIPDDAARVDEERQLPDPGADRLGVGCDVDVDSAATELLRGGLGVEPVAD